MSANESSSNNRSNLSQSSITKCFCNCPPYFSNLRHQVNNNFPHVLVGLHVSVSIGNVLQVEHRVNHGLQGAHLVRELWEHSVCKSLHQVCFVLREEKWSEDTQLKYENWKKQQQKKTMHRHTVLRASFLLPGGCESGGGWRASGLAWTAVCPEDRPLLSLLPRCHRAPICRPPPNSWHFAPSSGHQRSRGWRLPPCLRNYSQFFVKILKIIIQLRPAHMYKDSHSYKSSQAITFYYTFVLFFWCFSQSSMVPQFYTCKYLFCLTPICTQISDKMTITLIHRGTQTN